MAKKKVYKNLLVQYKGGGYAGCFWEWNYFLFDDKGQWHDLGSSGRRAIKTKDDAIEYLEHWKNDDSFSGPEYYSYNLKFKKHIKEFAKEVNPVHLDHVGTKVNEIYNKPLIKWDCDECGNTIECDHTKSGYPTMFHDPNNYTGDGGIGIIQYGKLCEDCYLNHTCGYCGEFNEPEQNNLDEDGHCEYCMSKEK